MGSVLVLEVKAPFTRQKTSFFSLFSVHFSGRKSWNGNRYAMNPFTNHVSWLGQNFVLWNKIYSFVFNRGLFGIGYQCGWKKKRWKRIDTHVVASIRIFKFACKLYPRSRRIEYGQGNLSVYRITWHLIHPVHERLHWSETSFQITWNMTSLSIFTPSALSKLIIIFGTQVPIILTLSLPRVTQ